MLGTHDLPLFVVSALLLNITPGPDTLYIVARSTGQGLRAGVVAALGIGAGIMVHITAAALGVSAIFAASTTAFTVLKLAGAAYLVYVAVSLFRAGAAGTQGRAAAAEPAGMWPVFILGFWTNVLNPKVALFFLAFLPQFVDSEVTSTMVPMLFLGLLFNFNGTLWNLFVAWSSARVGRALISEGRALAWFNRCLGAFFLYLAARLALSRQ